MTTVLEHEYLHRGAATDLFRTRDPEVLLSGPAGTGKSRACLEKLYVAACKYPGMRGLVVRKTQVSLTTTALVTWTKQVAAESIAAKHIVYYGGSNQEAAGYRFSNGSFIAVAGMDKPTRIMSSEYDMVYVQEAIELTEEDWEAITTRLRHGVMPYQQLLGDTNPSTPTHWLRQRVNRGATRMLESRWADNPMIYPQAGVLSEQGAAYLSKLENLTGVRRARLHDGLWVAAEGIIYEGWDEKIHVIDRAPVPKDWPRFWSVDFGYTNPMVVQRWAEDPDGRLVLYGEHYVTKTLVEDLAKELVEILKREPRPRAVICDHDAEDRATFERHTGLTTTPANKNVSEGLQAVAGRMKVVGDGTRITVASVVTAPPRTVVVGGPRRGKSTLSAEYLARGIPVYCGDPLSKVKDPMPGVNYLPEGLSFAGDDGGAAWVAENWFTMRGAWVCEGQVMARALRRWSAAHPDQHPCDQIIVLTEPRAATSAGQEAMHKGVMTVWREIAYRFGEIVRAPEFTVTEIEQKARPRLMLMRDAVRRRDQSLVDARKPASTLEEIPGYIWDDHKTKEQPRKEDDHGCDAMRYLVAERDLGARPKLRFIGQAY